MDGRHHVVRVAAVLAWSLGLASCSTSSTPPPSAIASPGGTVAVATAAPTIPPVTAAPAATTDPAPTPMPAPVSWGDAVLVRGVEACAASGVVASTPDASGKVHVLGDDITCTMEMNDPRVSGTKYGPFEIVAWGSETDGAFVQWGSPRTIENAGGSWVGTYTGIRTPQTGDLISIWFEGRGGYAGLSFFEWVVVPADATGTTRYPVTGLIFPAGVPMPSPPAP